MEDSNSTFQIVGELPEFVKNSQIIFQEELSVNSIVFFEKKDAVTTFIKTVDLENLDGFDELIYRVGKGTDPGQIVFEQIGIAALKETVAVQAELDQLLNQTFDHLSFFYRDTNLSNDQINRYYRGLIVQERGFVDASFHRGGLAAKHRFLIATSQAKDLSGMPDINPAHGLVIIMRDGFFKVLDVTKKEDRKQITLLHIPPELVEFFNSGTELSSVETQIAEAARADFEENFSAAPIEALCGSDWLNRLVDPIGISHEGDYFYTPEQTK